MELSLRLDIPRLEPAISYEDRILLIGSCFTEHISERLSQHKFVTLANPHGILFNPLSVASALSRYVSGTVYEADDLFLLNELWNSWDHHTRFSDVNQAVALERINGSVAQGADFIRKANWIFITLGSAFQYYLIENNRPVANNHRAAAQWFEKRLLDIGYITDELGRSMLEIHAINPELRFVFTVSPVRHIRDGVVDNNRSKARLLEAVHTLCAQFEYAHYFPAYELIIDVLRDYRFYDVDFVHPNYLATRFVWEKFRESCIGPDTARLMEKVREIVTAKLHRPRFPETRAHMKFRETYRIKTEELVRSCPFLNLGEELDYFSD